jgi:hypothetical protein
MDVEALGALATPLDPVAYQRAARGEIWRGICAAPLLIVVAIVTVVALADWADWVVSGFVASDGQRWSVGFLGTVCLIVVNGLLWPVTIARLRLRWLLHTWSPGSTPSLSGTVTERRWTRVLVEVATQGSSDLQPGQLTLPRDGLCVRGLQRGDHVVVQGVVRPGSWVAVTTPSDIGWIRLLPRRGWRLSSM